MTHDLQTRLARSLDKANEKEAARHTVKDFVKADNQRLQDDLRRCTKLSVSLFAGDLARLDAIRDYMATRGHRISTSQAIKLALRTAALDSGMEAALDAIRAEDGRKW